MASNYWLADAAAIARERIANNKATMKLAIGKPVQRRPNTAVLLAQALEQPESNPLGGREQLGQFARERYGEGARHIYEYLGLDPDGKELPDGDGSTVPTG